MIRVAHLFITFPLVSVFSVLSFGDEVRIACGPAPYENIFLKEKAGFERNSGHTLKFVVDPYQHGGADQTYELLQSGKADIASAAIPWDDWKALLKAKIGAKDADFKPITFRVIGKDLYKIVSNHGLGASNLSLDQAEGIFTGRFKSWKEVGGPDVPISIVINTKLPATLTFFQKSVLHLEPFSANAIHVVSVQDAIFKVQSIPGAATFLSTGVATPTLDVVQTNEPIGRPIVVLTKGKPNSAVMSFFEYISTQPR